MSIDFYGLKFCETKKQKKEKNENNEEQEYLR